MKHALSFVDLNPADVSPSQFLNALLHCSLRVDSEPRPRLVRPVSLPELGDEDLFILSRLINLQGDERRQNPEKFERTRKEKCSRERQASENVDRVSNSRIQAVADEHLRLGAYRKRSAEMDSCHLRSQSPPEAVVVECAV